MRRFLATLRHLFDFRGQLRAEIQRLDLRITAVVQRIERDHTITVNPKLEIDRLIGEVLALGADSDGVSRLLIALIVMPDGRIIRAVDDSGMPRQEYLNLRWIDRRTRELLDENIASKFASVPARIGNPFEL